MRKFVLAAVLAAAIPSAASAQVADFTFKQGLLAFAPDMPTCQLLSGISNGWFEYAEERDHSFLPTFIKTVNGKDYYQGSICMEFTSGARYTTERAFIWVWNRDTTGYIRADAFKIDCPANTIQKVKSGSGRNENEIQASTIDVVSPVNPIKNSPQSIFAASVCHVLAIGAQ